jgi:hypothetical protein
MADTHRKLTRPPSDASPVEVGIYRREVAAALSAVGVDFGDEYVVVKASEFNQQQTLDAEPGPEEAAAEVEDRELGPFARESETSRLAALDTFPRQDTHRWRILHAAARAEGATRDELEVLTGLGGNTVRPRVQELIEGGFIFETDQTRTTRHKSEATVVKITTKARDAINESRADQALAREEQYAQDQ